MNESYTAGMPEERGLMSDQQLPEISCAEQLRLGVFIELDKMTAEERGGRTPHAITEWLMDASPFSPPESIQLLGEEGAKRLQPHVSIIDSFQEVARRLWYIGRVRSGDRSLDWNTRLLWDITSAIVRDLYETTRAVVTLTAQGADAPAKVLLRHAMELYGRQLVVLRDPKEQRMYIDELQRLRDFQGMEHADGSMAEYRTLGLSGGALMDRMAAIEQNLDESSLPSPQRAQNTALVLRDLYAYFSNLTHGGPELVDDVLYVYDPSFPSAQRRRSWRFGRPTSDGILTLDYLTMLLWQFWRLVPRALERSALTSDAQNDLGVLLVAARALDRTVVQCFGSQVFSVRQISGA
jgi:hypothetical protein